MEWTKKTPTVLGVYWAFANDGKATVIGVLEHGDYNTKLVFNICGGMYELSEFDYWMGPIPNPAPPPIDVEVE